MRSWLSVLFTDAESKKRNDIPIALSLYSLSNKMDNSLLAVRDINHKYIVVDKYKPYFELEKENRKLKIERLEMLHTAEKFLFALIAALLVDLLNKMIF